MTEHTKGRLRVYGGKLDRLVLYVGGRHPVIAGVHQLGKFGGRKDGSDAMANARRLVAAWNLVDGIPTEDIEAGNVTVKCGVCSCLPLPEPVSDDCPIHGDD